MDNQIHRLSRIIKFTDYRELVYACNLIAIIEQEGESQGQTVETKTSIATSRKVSDHRESTEILFLPMIPSTMGVVYQNLWEQ